jgi:hypothetical protein
MVTVGVVARFEAKPGTHAEMERFFHNGLAIVEGQPSTTMWFAFRTVLRAMAPSLRLKLTLIEKLSYPLAARSFLRSSRPYSHGHQASKRPTS